MLRRTGGVIRTELCLRNEGHTLKVIEGHTHSIEVSHT